VNRHDYVEGAKEYKGHLGSPWDWVAKTLKAGVHGIPGGENMVKFRDGRVRYFTVREAARLTGFPDNIEFKMSRTQAIKGLGNAVPIPLAQAVGQWLSKAIISG
jgi:DNA (cytosine-5)-methyltransferase 1